MYSHTRRIGSVGRYGVKTGKRLRDEIRKIEDAAKLNSCPNCGKKIARVGSGVWHCNYCDTKLAGSSYFPTAEKASLMQERKE
jgi:large subunit ribosomal protein L37Ae